VAATLPRFSPEELFVMAKKFVGAGHAPSGDAGVRRHSMSPAQSKAHFAKHAVKTHFRNLTPTRLPMRGGIRL
jgi:hypothetical protein